MANQRALDFRSCILSEPPTAEEYEKVLRGLLADLSGFAGFSDEILSARLQLLVNVGRRDLGLARLVEGHLDAISILEESGQAPAPDAIYGIWASGGPMDTTRLEGVDGTSPVASTVRLVGTKPFCSGADIADRALVWVRGPALLIDVSLDSDSVTWDKTQWCVDAMVGVNTWTGTFDTHVESLEDWKQVSGWYFDRPGFWRGALCPAACWLGGAVALVEYAKTCTNSDPLAHRQLGELLASAYSMRATLLAAISDDPLDPIFPDDAYARSLAARHAVESGCLHILNQFSRLFGPRPLVASRSIARRMQELGIYIRQCHGDRDLAALGARAGEL